MALCTLFPVQEPADPYMVKAEIISAIAISLVIAAISIVLSELLRPKPKIEDARPAGLGDFKFPTAIEGRPVPVLWGTCKVEGPNVIWYGDLVQQAIKESVKTGLWSKKSFVKGFRYYVGIQFGMCLGQVDAIRRVWIGDKEVWSGTVQDGTIPINEPELFGGDDFGNGGVIGTLRMHSGSTTQAVNAYLTSFQSPQPAYRHLAYAVWEGGYIGNSTTIKPWKFELQRFPNGLGLTGGKEKVNTWDANPACVLYEFLTDTRWGLGFPSADIDVSNFQSAGDSFYTEGNGFSWVLDRFTEAGDFIREVERQIDGVVYLDPVDAKWRIALARDGYDIDSQTQVTDSDLLEVKDWNPGTWDSVINEVRVSFTDRSRDYFDTFAPAQNVAAQKLQGKAEPVTMNYPGVKNKTLANQIASREIRTQSRPLGKATLIVDRKFWTSHPGEVVAWTYAPLGITKLPMRVVKVNLGSLKDGRIELSLIEDIYGYRSGFVGDGQDTGWTLPAQDMDGIPSTEQVVEEAPWAICRRDPDYPETGDRIFAAARTQDGAIAFRVWERNSSGTPSGDFAIAGESYGFMLMGKLNTALARESANPAGGSIVQVAADNDTLADIKDAISSASAGDVGQNLVNLAKIGNEFIGFTGYTDYTTYIVLNSCYRGMLDTVPEDHAANAKVYLLHAGATVSDSTIPQTNNVDVQLRARSQTDESTEGESTTKQFTMANRIRRPYPPTELYINGTRYATSVNFDTLKTGGSTLDDRGIELTFTRRDFRTFDEVAGINTDAATLDSSFPSTHSTEYRAEAIDDPGGTPSSLFTSSWNGGPALVFLSRTKILRYKGSKPSTMEVSVETQHDYEGTTYAATRDLDHDFSLATSTLDDDYNWGNIPYGTVSATWTAPQTGTYTFNIGTAMPSGNVQARINGAGWVNVILAGNLTGNLAGVTASDTIEIQHLSNTGTSTETFLESLAPSGTVNAFAIMIY